MPKKVLAHAESITPRYIVPQWPLANRFKVASTTRVGDTAASATPTRSNNNYAGFNLGLHVGDDPLSVMANRRQLAGVMGADSLHWLNQVHGSSVARPGAELLPTADAYYCDRPAMACAVLTADCLPVVLASEDKDEFAVCHAGWRGLAAGVLTQALACFSSPAQAIHVWFGPAIGPGKFEVGEEVQAEFYAAGFCNRDQSRFGPAFVPQATAGKFLVNIYSLAEISLARQGVRQFYGGEYCTVSAPETFYSYRRDGVTGRMATVAMILP